MKKLHSQDDNKIDVLVFPDNIRSVSGMYIGSKGDCTNILREAIDNAMDELPFVPEFDTIIINTDDKGGFLVADKGRGMPIYMHPQYEGYTAARVAVSVINAGGKFSKTKVSAGQNGTGIKCTNALSELFLMIVKITKDNHINSLPSVKDNIGKYYVLEYRKGIYQGEYVLSLDEVRKVFDIEFPEDSSTICYFIPDNTIIKVNTYELPIYNFRYKAFIMREYYGKSISILVNGEEKVQELPQYANHVKHQFKKLYNAKTNKSIDLYFSFEISSDLRSKTYKGSVNSLVVNDGLHLRMAINAIRKAICNITGCENTYKLEQGLKVRSILSAVKVDFKSQTKEYCNVIDGWKDEMYNELVPEVESILRKNLKQVKDYVKRITELDYTYRKLKDKQYVESKIQKADSSKKVKTPPKQLIDAGSGAKDRDKCELFICEGKSAAGTLTRGRNPMIHAVLGLRGRPLNTVMRDIKQVVNNQEMLALINVIGMGVNISPNLKNKRFGKIIIAADADPDGGLITSSVLATIAVHMTFLLSKGMVYVAESPLFIQGNKFIYPSDDINKELDTSREFSRIKGLGELDESEAKKVFFNKETRRLIKVTPEGVKKAIRFLEKSANLRRSLAQEMGVLVGRFDHIEEVNYE